MSESDYYFSRGQIEQLAATEDNLRASLSAHDENIIVACADEAQERARIIALGLPIQRFRFIVIDEAAKTVLPTRKA